MTFFSVDNLAISFGGLQALQNIRFEVQEKEVFAIIGPNGAGKTTLFNCINGIYRPKAAGSVSAAMKFRACGRIRSPAKASPAPFRTSNSSPT